LKLFVFLVILFETFILLFAGGYKPKNELSVVDNGPQLQQIATLAEEVKALRETVNILISQIQGLRSEVKERKH
jgi:hypothetical protein